MKRFISTVLAVALLLGLGVLAVLARPGATGDLATPALAAPAASVALEPAAPAGTTMFNAIALPLDASASISPFTASGLAAYHGSSVKQVMKWNPTLQTFDSFVPGVSPPFLDFALAVGGSYFLELDSTSGTVFSIVGDVPAQASITFSLVKGASASECVFNSISLPLDQSGITTASGLATAVGGVLQVMQWNATIQTFDTFVPGVSPPFLDFAVKIGYPYFLCVNSAGPSQWPTYP